MTDWHRGILRALTTKIRVATVGQIARASWPGSEHGEASTKARLAVLERDGLLLVDKVPLHPELTVTGAIASWQPGAAAPDFGAVSYKLKARWTEHPRMTWLVSATKSAANLFNGHGGRMPREVERSHDVHLAGVYFWYRRNRPDDLPHWVFEERIRRERRHTREILPDVLLRTPSGPRVIECGGAYGKTKLQRLHDYCREQAWAYEIW